MVRMNSGSFGLGSSFCRSHGDVHVHRARRRHGVVTPDLVQQFVARERRAAVLDEVAEQLELPGRQIDRLPGLQHLGAPEVDRHVAEAVVLADRPGSRGARRSSASTRASSSTISNGLVR